MLKTISGKILGGVIAGFAVLSVLFVLGLSSEKAGKNPHHIELESVVCDSCFSPNGDGIRDVMGLTARFKGNSGKHVFSLLLVKKGNRYIAIRMGRGEFSPEGQAVVSLSWNGNDFRNHTVADGTYSLVLYYFNIPALFNQVHNHDAKKAVKQIEKFLLTKKKYEILKRWEGQVVVDRVMPVLVVTAPENDLETYDSSVPTSGKVEGAETMTINGSAVEIQNNEFSKVLKLEPGVNPFSYLAQDCAGNRAQESRIVKRLIDNDPPDISILKPQEGETYRALPLTVHATYSDSGSGIDPQLVSVLLNSSEITSSLIVTGSEILGEISDEALLLEGANGLSVGVSDKVGNRDTQTVHFTFEKVAAKDKTFIYGRVFDMANDGPLSGALVAASGKTGQSDGNGSWSLMFSEGGTYKIKIAKAGYSDVFRKVTLDKGEEAVVDDAYLTPLDSKTTPIGPEGGIHASSDGTVEVLIPEGALSETKPIQVTRFSDSKALPGDLNATDNLEYPISFIFCADFGPDNTTFAKPVKIRVKNTWGFEAGTQIPFAYWDENELKWIPEGMAGVDASKQWLEAEVSHFTTWDINGPIVVTKGGMADATGDPFPDCPVCQASQLDINTGELHSDFSIPGVKFRGGDTGVGFVYNSSTAFPTAFMRVTFHIDENYIDRPMRCGLKVATPLLMAGGGTGRGMTSFIFNAFSGYGSGGLILGGSYPSEREIETGYQDINFRFSHYYPGFYARSSVWGGMPTGNTGVAALVPANLEENTDKRVFMVSRQKSNFGRGWWLEGLKQLVLEGNRAVVIESDGNYQEFEQGINYADKMYSPSFMGASHKEFINQDSMFTSLISQTAQHLKTPRFQGIPAVPGVNQWFYIDLGQERDIYRAGIDFPRYWNAVNIWDFVLVSTSLDRQNWDTWARFGYPTLDDPRVTSDGLDTKIPAPLMFSGSTRPVRYIKYELGYPSINTIHIGSGVYQVMAIGDESQYRRLDGVNWPKFYRDSQASNYLLEEYTGKKTVFDSTGKMIAEIERSGRTTTYLYSGEKLVRIQHPENVFMEFEYAGDKISKVRDSVGRETLIETDSAGNVSRLTYADGEQREFSYDDRGLMIEDKKGEAQKKYIWNQSYPVLTQIELPNGAFRLLDSSILKFLLNDKVSTFDSPINFPALSSTHDGLESVLTLETGAKEKHVTGRGWSEKYVNGKLVEKITYANGVQNRLAVKIEKRGGTWETSEITYNAAAEVNDIKVQSTDLHWVKEDTGNNYSPFKPGTIQGVITTKEMHINYNEERLVSQITDYPVDQTFTYDEKGRVTQVDDGTGRQTRYFYNTEGDLIRSEYPDGRKNEMTYDDKGLLVEMKNNNGTKTLIDRDDRGDAAAISDEENRRVELTRDIMGRVTKEKSPSGREVNYQWGGAGCSSCGDNSKLSRITDSAGKIWEFKYDIMGNPVEMVYPDGSKITQDYDVASRLIKFTNRRGQEILYNHDLDNRVTKKITPEGDINFGYDSRGRISDITSSSYHYQYEYGVIQGGMGTHLDRVIVREKNLLNGTWLESLVNRYGVPDMVFDSFNWWKSFEYNWSLTPGGFLPSQVSTGSVYIGTSHLDNFYTYDAALRVSKKQNRLFCREDVYSYDSNGIMSRMRYQNGGCGAYYPQGELNFVRDQSGLISGISGDRQAAAVYNSDIEITAVHHTLPQVFDEEYPKRTALLNAS